MNTDAINFNLAEALHLSGDTDRALQMLHKFLTVASSLLGHEGQDRVAILLIFAEAHSKTNDRKKAAEFYSKALKLLKVESPRNNAEIAELLNTLGNLFYEIGDRSSALRVRYVYLLILQQFSRLLLSLQLTSNLPSSELQRGPPA